MLVSANSPSSSAVMLKVFDVAGSREIVETSSRIDDFQRERAADVMSATSLRDVFCNLHMFCTHRARFSLHVGYSVHVNAHQQANLGLHEPGNRASCSFINLY